MPTKLDLRCWIFDVRKKNKTLNLKSKIYHLKPAFTLIELLVVIGIMAVLAGTIIISTNFARAKGKDSRRKQDLAAINSALTSYYTDHKQFPPSSPGTNPQRDFSSGASTQPWIPDLVTYINKIPKDPLQSSINNFLAETEKNVGKLAANLTANSQANQGTVLSISSGVLGNPNITGPPDCWTGFFLGTKFQMGANTGWGNTMSVYINSTGLNTSSPNNKFELAVYNDDTSYSPSRPGTLVAYGQGTITAAGWNQVTFGQNITFNANANYWLLYVNNEPSCGNKINYDATSGTIPGANNSVDGPWDINTSTTPPDLSSWGSIPTQNNHAYSIKIPYSYGGQDIGGPGPFGFSYLTSRGDCDADTNAYCLRVSNNLRAYVLWTTLENTNDPEVYSPSNPNAKCNPNDTDWTTLTSPFYQLNVKASDGNPLSFNYCIKSPPL